MATILIAEDDHAISDLVAYNLERAGHTPLAAYDGQIGRASCRERV